MYEDEDLQTSFIRHVVMLRQLTVVSSLQTNGVNSGEVGEDVEGKGIAARTPNYQISANRWNPAQFLRIELDGHLRKIMTKHQKHIASSSIFFGIVFTLAEDHVFWANVAYSCIQKHGNTWDIMRYYDTGILIENMICLLCRRCIRSWFHVSWTHLYGFPISWALISWW